MRGSAPVLKSFRSWGWHSTWRSSCALIDTPQLAWILPLIQVLWVNTQGLFVLGPIIIFFYLADRLAGRILGLTTDGSEGRPGRNRWWAHVGGATVMVGLACLGNPYGLRGALLPLELLPKITAWGAQYKSYIIEFGDLQEFVRKQGVAATSGLYLRADCFLLWVVPLSFIIPAIWRTGRADISSPAWTKGCIGGFGLTVSLVLASALGFPGPGTPDWLVRLGRLAPLGLIVLGALRAVVLVRSSRRAALLAVMAGVTLATWVLWLRVHLFGLEPGPSGMVWWEWLVRSGMGHRADWWCDGACSSFARADDSSPWLWRSRFSYLALRRFATSLSLG